MILAHVSNIHLLYSPVKMLTVLQGSERLQGLAAQLSSRIKSSACGE